MDAYEKIIEALAFGRSLLPDRSVNRVKFDDALAALAEQERAAATPVAIVRGTVVEWVGAEPMAGTRLYTTPPPAQVAEMREPAEVTDEMCDRAYIRKWRGVPELIGHDPDDEDRQWAREWIEAWRAELGPTLGLVEMREPTPAKP